MNDEGPTPSDAFRALECIAAEFRPEIKPLNVKSLAYVCEAVAREHPGHLHDRIGTLLGISGLATLFVGPKSMTRQEYVEAVNGEWG